MSKLNTPFPASASEPIDPNQLPPPEDDGTVIVDLNPEPEEPTGDSQPTPASVDDGYKEKFEGLQTQMEELQKKVNAPTLEAAPQLTEPRKIDFPALDLGDVYAEPEKVQENIQKYIEGLVPQIQEQAIEKFKNTPEIQALTTGFYQDKYERQIEAARQKYGTRFTFDKDADPYMTLIQQGKSVDEAHILLDHGRQETERLDTQLKQQIEDEKRKTLGIPSGMAIRPNYNKELVFKLSKDEQWAARKGFPELSEQDAYKKYAESKQRLLSKG